MVANSDKSFEERLQNAIPGGAHTYSRGSDQFPRNAPQILASGKGAYVLDPQGNRYLDYGMGLRAVNIGYSEPEINRAAIAQIENGNNLTRASVVELEAAEAFLELIDSADMVKFAKNGSTAVSAAVKLARAYTGRTIVARCAQHPFFSYDDWFIGSTPITKGIPAETIEQTKTFNYNDIKSLEALIASYPNKIACVVLEPATIEEPSNGFLNSVQRLCEENGIVFILDEMITGFRWHLKGAQHSYKVTPHLCTFGKAMANGFSVACLAGKREIMKLGSIEIEGMERTFLVSTTHGAEMSGLGAFIATLNFMQRENVVDHLWRYGESFVNSFNSIAKSHGIESFIKASGVACSPYYTTLGPDGAISTAFRTLFLQEMVKAGVLMPWVALSYRHGDEELRVTERAFDRSMNIYKKALKEGVERYLIGPPIKPVFRRFN